MKYFLIFFCHLPAGVQFELKDMKKFPVDEKETEIIEITRIAK